MYNIVLKLSVYIKLCRMTKLIKLVLNLCVMIHTCLESLAGEAYTLQLVYLILDLLPVSQADHQTQ